MKAIIQGLGRGTAIATALLDSGTVEVAAVGEEVKQRLPVPRVSWRDVDRRLAEEFAAAIQSGAPSETDLSDNARTLEWLFLAQESAASGIWAKAK